MANPKYAELVFPLDLGLDEVSVPERVAADAFTLQRGTRLSVQPGAPVKQPGETSVATLSGAPQVHGMAAAGDVALAFFDPITRQQRIVDSDVTEPLSTTDNVVGQNRYVPAQIEASGAVCGDLASGLPAVQVDAAGNVWYAYVKRYDTVADGHLYISVHSADGEKLVPARRIQRITNSIVTAPWCGLTFTTTGGMVVWFRDDLAAGAYKAMPLTLAANRANLTLGAATTVYTPLSTLWPSLTSDGAQNAYLLTRHSATVDRLNVCRVHMGTFAIANLTLGDTTANTNLHTLCIEYAPTATAYLLYSWSEGTTPTSGYGVVHVPSFSQLWFAAGPAIYGPVACAPSVVGATAADAWGVFAISKTDGYVGTATNYARTELMARRLDGTAGTPVKTVPWMRLYDTGTTWKRARSGYTSMFPLFGLARCYAAAALPSDVGFVEDPCVQQFLVFGSGFITMAPIVRYGAGTGQGQDGVDLTMAATFSSFPAFSVHGKNSLCVGDKLYNAYNQFRGYNTVLAATGYVPIFVRSTLEGGAFRACPDTRGGSVVVAAMPWYWDGFETTELGATYRPKVVALATGGSGANMTGTYAIRAVYTWRNAFGEAVRSAPSVAVTIAPAGTKPQIWVSLPNTVRDGVLQGYFDVDLYVRDVNADSLYYLYREYPTSRNQDGCFYYGYIAHGAYSTLTPSLYSTGGAGTQLLPNAPQPLWDAALVGKRLIGIDAETRTTIVVSKEKEVGIALEFASELNLAIDGCAGLLTAVSEMGGDAVVFAERGIYSVAGDARDNLGNGNGFDRPRIVSDMGCVDKLSVVRCPAGVLFRTIENNFALWSGGGLTVFDKVRATTDVVGTAVFSEQDEVVFFFAGGTRKVFNYRLQRWSEWTMSAVPEAVVQCADGTALYFTDSGGIVRMDPDTYNTTALMAFATGWIIPESDQGDCTFYEFVWQAIRRGPHGVQFEIAVDYGDYDPDLTRVWTAAEVANFVGDDQRYSLVVSFQRTARAIRVRITELEPSGDGMRPLSCTLCYSSTARGHQRTTVMAEGQKK